MPRSQRLYGVFALLSCCLLLLDLILHSSRIKKKKIIQLAENVNENTYFFYLCLSVSVVSSSASACIRVALSSSVTRFRALPVFFTRHVIDPVISTGLFVFSLLMYLSICTFPPLIIHHSSFCVLFSVSKLFVPFSVSFLSLLGPCVEGGQCCLSTLCG